MLYIIDILKPKELDNETEAFRSELLFIHDYLFRGTTTNFAIMKHYFEYMKSFIGKYVEFIIYEWDVDIDKNISNENLALLALHYYNSDPTAIGTRRIANVPVLLQIPTKSGSSFIITSALYSIFQETYYKDYSKVNYLMDMKSSIDTILKYMNRKHLSDVEFLRDIVSKINYSLDDKNVDEAELLDYYLHTFEYIN